MNCWLRRRTKGLITGVSCGGRDSGVAHIAVHGGGIEVGTAEVADAVAAANGHDYYAFVGLRSSGNNELHITSVYFDEPMCVELQRASRQTISYHGCAGGGVMVHLGGGDEELKLHVGRALVGGWVRGGLVYGRGSQWLQPVGTSATATPPGGRAAGAICRVARLVLSRWAHEPGRTRERGAHGGLPPLRRHPDVSDLGHAFADSRRTLH
jgi:hypothetical protein